MEPKPYLTERTDDDLKTKAKTDKNKSKQNPKESIPSESTAAKRMEKLDRNIPAAKKSRYSMAETIPIQPLQSSKIFSKLLPMTI